VVGGLVSSASALVILLAAISLHQLGFGLLLIVAFSAGMAAVLAGMGLALVYAGRAMERVSLQRQWISGLASRIPLLTALVVLVSGLVLAVRAALQIGLV
jgi:nickel/cobalt transporter (NicO) family protein